MSIWKRRPWGLARALFCVVAATATPGPLVQPVAAAAAAIEEVVVTGTRRLPRSAVDSAVPVDVFTSDSIESASHSDTHDILQTLVPSYNVARQPISDGATFIRPATLRGLSSDKTLVLVNSKRRHRAALVSIGGSGTQGPDVATIPSAALDHIEVLRDGAAAQYGSDAIAGVINFILKDDADGFSMSFDTGEYYDGDGFQTTVQGNLGLPLGAAGFLNISGEYSKADFTERADQYCEPWFCVDPDLPGFDPTAAYAAAALDPDFQAGLSRASVEGSVVQPWGAPNTETARLFFNAGYELSDTMELYSFGNYSTYEGDGGFFYRYPGNGTIEDLRLDDGSVYNFLEIFPGGFTPRFEGEITDYSLVGGLKGQLENGFIYDVSLRYGYDEIAYFLENTVNPSLGPATPTAFKPGDLINDELQAQIDLSQEFGLGLASPMVVAVGLSYLDESYEVKEGEVSSYAPGPFAESDPFGFCNGATPTAAGVAVISDGSSLDCADPDDPVYTVVGVGSNGFPGYSPEFSDKYSRDSYAGYLDVSADVTDALFLQGAMRYEDYSDFGSELVGKLAGMFRVNENFALRASVGTGFRAPTPGQQGTTNVSTRLPNGLPVATGLFPASSSVAQALGARDLTPEKSTNYTFGATADIGDLAVTIDFYRIDIDDQVYAISTLDVATDPASGAAFENYQALVSAGVVGAESIGGVFYFTNAFDSRTQGVDLVATYPLEWGNGSATSLTASLNYNEKELTSDAGAFLNDEDQFDFENQDPNWRGVFTAIHNVGRFSALGRLSFFGASEDSQNGTTSQKFDETFFVDLEASYQINENFRATVGGRNVFDEYPDKIDKTIGDYCCGRVYASSSIVPWQGGYYFLRLNVDF
jgi:iron complex outermembrane receptor protein